MIVVVSTAATTTTATTTATAVRLPRLRHDSCNAFELDHRKCSQPSELLRQVNDTSLAMGALAASGGKVCNSSGFQICLLLLSFETKNVPLTFVAVVAVVVAVNSSQLPDDEILASFKQTNLNSNLDWLVSRTLLAFVGSLRQTDRHTRLSTYPFESISCILCLPPL